MAEESAHSNGGLQPLRLRSLEAALEQSIVAWAASVEPRGKVLSSVASTPGKLVHARFASFGFGFVDDLLVQVDCSVDVLPGAASSTDLTAGTATDGLCTVQAQGQLRLGQSDLAVNQARIGRLWGYLRTHFQSAR